MPKILNLSPDQKLIRLREQKMNYYYRQKRNSYMSNHKKKWLKVMREMRYRCLLKEGIDLIALKRKRKYCLKRIDKLKLIVEEMNIYLNSTNWTYSSSASRLIH